MRVKSNQLIIALIVLAIWLTIVVIIPTFLRGGTTESLDSAIAQGIGIQNVIGAIFLLAAIFFLGWRREVGLKEVGSARSLLLAWLPMLFILVFLGNAIFSGVSLTTAATFVIINTLLVGFSEELVFRGVLFYGALTRFGVWTAMVFTSFIFGATHVLNGFSTGDFPSAAVQALTAGISGLWFTAILLRTKSIVPGMILHGLWDCAILLNSLIPNQVPPQASDPTPEPFTAMSIIAPLLLELPLFLYALWLLRGVGKQDKEELLNEQTEALQ